MAATMKLTFRFNVFTFSIYFVNLIFCCTCATPYKYFSTKTPYEWVHSSHIKDTNTDALFYMNELKGMSCSALHTSAVIRHGARFPGLEDVHEISNIHAKLISAIEPDVHPDLYNWVNKFPSNNNKALSQLGEEEQENLGKRIAQKLSTLFSDEDFNNFRFIVSSQERTKQSASAFYEGFTSVLQREDDIEDEFDTEVNDELMRFFNLCAKYVYTVERNKTAHNEYYAFMGSEVVNKINNKIHEKLGLKENILTTANVRLIYLVCGYETAVYKHSPWCSLLDEKDMEVLEYLGDLKHYYKNSYGYNITCDQSCPLIAEIFLTMDEVITEIENGDSEDETNGYIVGQFAFGHAETLGPLYCGLDLFKDPTPLTAENHNTQKDYKFRTSEILPFSANLMFILYECVPEELGEDEEIEEADYYLKLFVNEKPLQIPGCEALHCPYKVVRERFHQQIDHCDFKHICQKPALKLAKEEL
ncbi:unnamed protein product [Lymnaea stagnalis]|uniref:Multiple inositol polyphosphate phosphatase 1 n=1 Tax=Lymnaea stagnalis TaxID=6523 RepID=A0AAV2IC84_LYMST